MHLGQAGQKGDETATDDQCDGGGEPELVPDIVQDKDREQKRDHQFENSHCDGLGVSASAVSCP
ncbi:hypothetical protein BLA3211_08013 [Burkholderia aenigmatica]|uniref:Uncharacterized protein n=1 Tax=Burkholderia aenigmatica TaxID=2015348 RepID=A0A6J5JQU7_9BURK|nr:hypothetical protein BLA3211_08013 [Burkholderia aenigmatica]